MRGGERKEEQQEARPANGQKARATCTVACPAQRAKTEPSGANEMKAPGKEPQQVEQPECHARHRVVIAWITQSQKTQDVLIHEVKPEEPVILAGCAVHGEINVRRHSQARHHMPGRGNQQKNQKPTQGMDTLPDVALEKLSRKKKVQDQTTHWNYHSY